MSYYGEDVIHKEYEAALIGWTNSAALAYDRGEEIKRLRTALLHMGWCRSCAEDPTPDTPECEQARSIINALQGAKS